MRKLLLCLSMVSVSLLYGCAGVAPVNDDVRISRVKEKAVGHLACQAEDLAFTKINDSTYGVTGCGRRASYVLFNCESTPLNLNTASRCKAVLNSDVSSTEPRKKPQYKEIKGTYHNKTYNYSVRFPEGWSVLESFRGAGVSAVNPNDVSNEGRAQNEITVTVTELSANTTLDTLADRMCMFRNCHIEEKGDASIHGSDAKWAAYSLSVPERFRNIAYTHFKKYIVIRNNEVYEIGYASMTHEKYSGYVSSFDEIVNSFLFID